MSSCVIRFQHLHAAIQEIKLAGRKGFRVKGKWVKSQRLGTNAELARFCGVDDDVQTHRWFWTESPTVIPRAGVTLQALRWLCAKRHISKVLIPDWEALWFHLSYDLCHHTHDYRDVQKEASDPKPATTLVMDQSKANEVAVKEGVTPRSIRQYAQYRWKMGRSTRGAESREPDGEFALEYLADNLSADKLSEFIDFFGVDLPKYPYQDLPKKLAPKTKLIHESLITNANWYWSRFKLHPLKEDELYAAHTKNMPAWLRKILL